MSLSSSDPAPALAALTQEPVLRMTICRRKRTRGNVYDYTYWECGRCFYHPGGSDGPPTERCINCGDSHYTRDAEEAIYLLRITGTSMGLGFQIAHDFEAIRQLKRAAEREAAALSSERDALREALNELLPAAEDYRLRSLPDADAIDAEAALLKARQAAKRVLHNYALAQPSRQERKP